MTTLPKEIETQLQTEANIVTQAQSIIIKTEADNLKATALLTAVKALKKKVNATFKPMLDSAKATLATIKAEHAKFADPLGEAEEDLRTRIGQFIDAENKRRESLQAKEDAKYAKKEAKAEAKGELCVAVPVIVPNLKTADGVSTSKRWRAEVVDFKALIDAVSRGELPTDMLLPNQVALNRIAVALKEATNLPGVQAKYEISTIVRGI